MSAGPNADERTGPLGLGEIDPTVLDRLVDRCGLTPFEHAVLLAACAATIAPSAGSVSFAAMLEAHPQSHWSATLPDAPLRANRLIALAEGPLISAPITVDERVLHALHGLTTLDERLLPYVVAVTEPSPSLPTSRRRTADALAAAWTAGITKVLVHGCDADDRLDVVALAARETGRRTWRMIADEIPASTAERDGLAHLWNREALLDDVVLVIEVADDRPDVSAQIESLLARIRGTAVVSTHASRSQRSVETTVPIERPSRDEQLELWRSVFPPGTPDAAARSLVAEFDLPHTDILRAADHGFGGLTDDLAAVARERCIGRVRHRLDGVAQRIEPRAGWDDLVLPAAQHRLVRQFAAAAGGRRRLHRDSSARISSRGAGLSAMFCGPSGTGKTLAAEVVARELSLDLHRVDLAAIVSKWIGETEKHLRQIFDAAERGGTVLLFDEADALFGKRSEVRDSHDRYANLEVSYLLQRMEQYRGVVVLTTNMRSAIDPAFLRRLRYVVHFPHPDLTQRADLWRRAFAEDVPTEGLDLDLLARLDLTGGDITSVASHALLLASADRTPIRMAHMLEAAVAEFVKLERPLAELEAWR